MRKQCRFEIIEINAGQRLSEMKIARFAVQSLAVPVEDPIRGIGVLLDFENYQARAERMNAATGQKHRITAFHSDPMKTFRDVARAKLFFECMPRRAALQAGEKF